jgi:hypothetical protein
VPEPLRGLRPFSIPGAVRTIRRSPASGTQKGEYRGAGPLPFGRPLFSCDSLSSIVQARPAVPLPYFSIKLRGRPPSPEELLPVWTGAKPYPPSCREEGCSRKPSGHRSGRGVKPQPLLQLSVCLVSGALCCPEITERSFVQCPARRRLHRPQRGSSKAAAECRLEPFWPQRLGCRCPLSLPAWRLFQFVLR